MSAALLERPRPKILPLPRHRSTAGILFLALGTRLAVVWYVLGHLPSDWFFRRGLEMGLIARSLLRGEGFSSPFGPSTGSTAIVAPGYPIVVAGIFRVFGEDTRASAAVLMGCQLAINLLTVWLILRLARRLASERAALTATAVWAVSPPLLWMPTIFWETSFSCCALLLLIEIAVGIASQTNHRKWLSYGTFAGFATLTNPALLPSALAIGSWSAIKGSRRRHWYPALAGLAFCLVYAGWPLRNALVFKTWIPARTTMGLELWMGNREGAEGFLDTTIFPTFNAAELAQYRALGEVPYIHRKQQLALAASRQRPGRFLRLCLARVARFWFGSGTQNGSIFFPLHAAFTTLFGFAGLFALAGSSQRRLAALFVLPLAIFPLPYYVTHAEFRYRLVLDPLLTVLMARGLDRLAPLLLRDRDVAGQSVRPPGAAQPALTYPRPQASAPRSLLRLVQERCEHDAGSTLSGTVSGWATAPRSASSDRAR